MATKTKPRAMRVSYSILSAWARGDYDRAVAPFTGREIEPTEAMTNGKNQHEVWERHGRKTGSLPNEFGGDKLVNPLFESDTKRAVRLPEPYDWIELSGVLDVLHNDEREAGDFKLSKAGLSIWTNSYQHKVYKVLYPKIEKFTYYVKHPITGEVKVGIVHVSKNMLVEGIEYIITHASDLRAYLEDNGASIYRQSHEAIKTNKGRS